MEKRPLDAFPWLMPSTCPSCGSHVVRVDEEVAVRCPNEKLCKEQQIKRIIYFVSKHAMDINHMGEKVVIQLFERGFIKTSADIYQLDRSQISQLEGFKEKSIQNLLESIESSKNVSLSRFLMGLGIKHVGTGTSELLASKAGSLESLMSMSEEGLKSIEGVGDKVASAIVIYFADSENRHEIERLLNFGVKPKVTEAQTFTGHVFQGKNFVLTGSLEQYTRTNAASLIKERGGKVTDSISKKTNYLIVGKDAGSKLEKAKDLGVKVLNEDEFTALL